MEHLGKEKLCLSSSLQGLWEKGRLDVTLLPQIIERDMLGQEGGRLIYCSLSLKDVLSSHPYPSLLFLSSLLSFQKEKKKTPEYLLEYFQNNGGTLKMKVVLLQPPGGGKHPYLTFSL